MAHLTLIGLWGPNFGMGRQGLASYWFVANELLKEG